MNTQIKKMRRMQVTCNNPVEKGFTADAIKETMERWNTEYYCFCFETGDQGTEHFHLYIKFKYPQALKTISKAFGNAHIEDAHGNSKQNRDYIRKEGAYLDSEKKETNHIETFFESGECPVEETESKGYRSDLKQIDAMLQKGLTPNQILEKLPFFYRRYEKDIRGQFFALRSRNVPPRRNIKVVWHVGESGTGKSNTYVKLCKEHGEESIYLLTDYDTGGFDMYCGEPILFMDEFKGSMKLQQLLNYLEGYKIQIHCRYANARALWNEVHITSVYPPDEVYRFMVDQDKRNRDRLTQLLRRINTIVYHYIENDDYKTLEIPGKDYVDYNILKALAKGGKSIGDGFFQADESIFDELPAPQ